MESSATAELGAFAFFKKLVHYLSLVISFCLVLLAVLGFQQLSQSRVSSFEQVESTTSDGCLLFLGVTFGALLFLGEYKWELFFYFFGFLRYRFGRSILYAVSGIMTILMGRTRSSCTGCTTYSLLIAEGVGLLVIAVFQLVSIVVFGNNTAPQPPQAPARTEKRTDSGSKAALVPLSQREINLKSVAISQTSAAPAPPPTSPFETKLQAKPPSPTSPKNPNMPSWMQA
ncbi:hypothetical protein H310_14064 [Aphanomyces invadans]|uniref:Uncharacterized protein n=1 Tax=Aphanomyces invadans TaxID=157072 RepID=A0A024TBP5_9STRA|nr:hypothetical protein H310_14064 [Aphanomyces invadans]ETV91394.1 hypothetical protein H310_14064 [Aphanomyces invadans]|eukprot:XP_008880022.1 hypothetical protein H310_14064 [Aphanomyces invadans]